MRAPRSAEFPRAWRALVVLCALALTVADTALLGAGTGFLTNGFNSPHIDWIALALLFLPAALLLDLWLVLCIWLVGIPILRLLSRSPLQVVICAVLAGAGAPVAIAAVRYNIHSVMGDMFSLVVSQQFSGLGSPKSRKRRSSSSRMRLSWWRWALP